MLKIVKFRFQGLWNSEYPLVVIRLLEILDRHNPHTIHLGFSFDRLSAFRQQLENITVLERTDSESPQLNDLDHQRDTLFNVIYSAAKAFQRAPSGDISSHASKIISVFKKHGNNIPTTNYTAQSKRMGDLIADITSQPDILNSLKELSLLTMFEQMSSINREFDALFMERKYRRGETERLDIRNVRLECDKAITFLWNSIEMCISQYGAEKYITLVNTINELNSYYKQRLAARATRRKTKQSAETEEPIIPIDDSINDN